MALSGHRLRHRRGLEAVKRPGDRLSGACFTSGSAGTIGCGDYLKEVYPGLKLAVGEALQCPTILENGFGDHRIEASATNTSPGSTM